MNSLCAIAIIAALPRELAQLARDLRATPMSSSNGILLQTANLPGSPRTILLATAGMGSERVALAVSAALAHGPIATLLSIGLAGACDPALTPGTVLEPTVVIDTRSGERFETAAPSSSPHPVILATSPHIASPSEKGRLRAAYNASAVDMEAAVVARLARAHNLPFRALKAISDEHTVDLAHLAPFSDSRGHFRTAPFALHVALRPHLWHPTVRLGRNTAAALQALTLAAHQLLAELSSAPVAS